MKRIKAIAAELNISADTIRYYEKIGALPVIPRDENGIRYFDQQTIQWIIFVKNLKGAGVSLSAIAEYVELAEDGDSTIPDRKNILINQRAKTVAKIESLQKTLDVIDKKIENYDLISRDLR